jgi:GrpB-like predicted nucleotidyltransferase (UPF0157 family)
LYTEVYNKGWENATAARGFFDALDNPAPQSYNAKGLKHNCKYQQREQQAWRLKTGKQSHWAADASGAWKPSMTNYVV